MPSAAPPRLATNRLDTELHVDPDDARGPIKNKGGLNRFSTRLWEIVLASGRWDLVLDIGANCGEMLLSVELPSDARVIAYEPNPRVLPYLRRSVSESDVPVDVRGLALSDVVDTQAVFSVATVWSGCSGIATTHRTDSPHHRIDQVIVPATTLDAELAELPWSALAAKIDVEGGELAVLAGARRLLADPRPWIMMLEIAHLSTFEIRELVGSFAVRLLDKRTGSLFRMPPVTPAMLGGLLTSDWLYTQDAVLTRNSAS